MDIELGIQNVVKPVNFTTDQSAEEVSAAIATAMEQHRTIDLVDDRGRHIIVPASALGYAIIGSETTHPVGFGAL